MSLTIAIPAQPSLPQQEDSSPPGGTARTTVRPVGPSVLAERIERRRHDRRPAQLQWHERSVSVTGNYLQLAVPLVGQYDSGLATELAVYLDQLWTDRPTACGTRITSVSALVGRQAGRSTLVLFLSLDGVPTEGRVDDSRMARHLRMALARIDQRRPPTRSEA